MMLTMMSTIPNKAASADQVMAYWADAAPAVETSKRQETGVTPTPAIRAARLIKFAELLRNIAAPVDHAVDSADPPRSFAPTPRAMLRDILATSANGACAPAWSAKAPLSAFGTTVRPVLGPASDGRTALTPRSTR
jgi:hypothetical protein